MENNKPLLRVKNLKKYFPIKKTSIFAEQQYVKANDGITLEVFPKETVGLVGESGCGKSTLGRVILQLYEQTGGATFFYGRSLEDVAPSYVFKTIKNLSKDVNELEANREKRRKAKADIANATNDKDRKKAQKEFDDVDALIDTYFDTTIKIFGGLVLSNDLKTVSSLVDKWYTIKGEILKESRSNNLLILDRDALVARGKDASKVESKITVSNNKIKKLNADLSVVDNKILDIKETLEDNEKFERYESRRDTGIDLARLTTEEMRLLRTDLQIIFQDPYSSLNPRMTIGQLIGEALVTHGYYKEGTDSLYEYIVKTMEECGLDGSMIHRYPHEFSGGQRQRIGIARALALKPKFIVCDEAVSALDVSIQSQIINLLQELKEENDLTYLFISHDLGVVRYISDRIGVMYFGKMVELAPAEEIFTNPLHPYTRQLLNAIPKMVKPGEENIQLPLYVENDIYDFPFKETKKADADWYEASPGHFVACRVKNPSSKNED